MRVLDYRLHGCHDFVCKERKGGM